MNAAMHGVSRSEVLERLPEIVSFAEIEEFLELGVRELRLDVFVGFQQRQEISLAAPHGHGVALHV